MTEQTSYTIAALYHFTEFEDYETWRAPLLNLLTEYNVRGTLLLASEGINGTIAGPQAGIDAVLSFINNDSRFDGISVKFSYADYIPFNKTRVRLKKEIVTFREESADPQQQVGTYVEPKDWNDLISDPEVVVIDTRNDYEVGIGTFKGAENPKTDTFTQLTEYVAENLDPEKHKKVAMFCTGGIRCEKSTAYMLSQGFENVYHLHGGILKYLEEVPEENSLWEGECFVFDKRVSVTHGVKPGKYDICHACRMPIDDEDKQSEKFENGISCPHCYDSLPEKTRARARERQKQIDLKAKRGE